MNKQEFLITIETEATESLKTSVEYALASRTLGTNNWKSFRVETPEEQFQRALAEMDKNAEFEFRVQRGKPSTMYSVSLNPSASHIFSDAAMMAIKSNSEKSTPTPIERIKEYLKKVMAHIPGYQLHESERFVSVDRIWGAGIDPENMVFIRQVEMFSDGD